MFETQHVGDVVVLTPTESIDGRKAARAREFIEQLLDSGVSRLAFDLTQIDFIDSSGIGVLVSSLRKCKERGGGVSLFGLSENLVTIFEVTMLHEVFVIVRDRQSAIAEVKK